MRSNSLLPLALFWD